MSLVLSAFLLLAVPPPPPPDVGVRDAWVAEPIAGRKATAAYFVIENRGTSEARLTACSTTVAAVSEIHRVTGSTGRVSMGKVDEVAIPPRGSVAFEPGGYHVMLIDLRKPLAAGEHVDLRLDFAGGGSIEVDAPVRRRETR